MPPTIDANIPSWTQLSEEIRSEQQKQIARGVYELDYQRKLTDTNNLGARIISGATLATLGVPKDLTSLNPRGLGESVLGGALSLLDMTDGQLKVGAAFDLEMPQVLDAAINEVVDIIEDKAADIIGPAVDVAMNAIGAIPIAGWVVRIGYAFGKAVAGLVKLARAQAQEEPEFRDFWSGYSPTLDLSLTNSKLYPTLAQSPYDVTRLFSPPGHWQDTTTWAQTGGGFEFTKLKEPKGWRVQSRSRLDMLDQGWIGIMPGANKLHVAIECSRDGDTVTDYGQMFPTTAQQGAQVWSQIEQPGVMMYSINVEVLRDRWMYYFWSLRKAIAEFVLLGDNPSNQDRPPKAWAKGVVNYLADVIGWKRWDESIETDIVAFDERDVWGLYDIVPVKALNTLGENQHRFGRTNLCVYTSIESAAFHNYETLSNAAGPLNSARWDRVKQARSWLAFGNQYQNARCLIDVDNVPDEAVRQAIAQTQASCPPPHTLLNVQPIALDPSFIQPDDNPSIPPPLRGMPTTSGTGGGGMGAVAVLGLVGVAGVGYMLTRGKR